MKWGFSKLGLFFGGIEEGGSLRERNLDQTCRKNQDKFEMVILLRSEGVTSKVEDFEGEVGAFFLSFF